MKRHGVVRNARYPEEPAFRNSRVVVVALMVGVNLTFIKVQSDEAERTVVALAVFADVNALHEAHVGLEEKLRGLASFGVNPNPVPKTRQSPTWPLRSVISDGSTGLVTGK
jgi:hypothetical protein